MSAMQAVIPANAGIPGQARDDVSWGFVIPAYAGIPGRARDDGKVDR